MSKPYRAIDMEILDQEKFSTLKALAEMQVRLSEGQAEMKRLEEEKEEYLKMREEEGNERVAKVLAESRDALEQTTKNHDELSHYGDELKAFADSLKSCSDKVVTLCQDFRTWMKGETEKIDEKRAEVSEQVKKMKVLEVEIAEDRKQLVRESARVAEEMRLLEDRRGLLERGFAELKRKQEKL